MRTRVKICGITRPQDGRAAAQAGADAIGLVFYARSPRYVEVAQAAEICAALPPFVSVVGLFVNAPREQVASLLQQLHLDLLQFHGTEPADQCEGFDRPYIKAIGMKDGVDVTGIVQAPQLYPYIPNQLIGVLGAIKGAAEYEQVMIENFPKMKDNPLAQEGLRRMGPQLVAHTLIIVLIIIANVIYFIEKKRGDVR